VTHEGGRLSDEPTDPAGPVTALPGKAWTARSEYDLRTCDEDVLRVGDYLRARGLLEGPSPNRAWASKRRKSYTRLARRRNRGAGEAA
jgi:hypothetical protein